MPGQIDHRRSTRWHEEQAQPWNASATSAGVLSATTTTIGIIAGVRPAVAGTMTTIVAVRCRHGMTRDDSPARDRATTMTMMTTAEAAVGTVAGTAIQKVTPRLRAAAGTIPITAAAAGTAIPRAIRRPRGGGGKSAAVLAAAIATMIAAAQCRRGTMRAAS